MTKIMFEKFSISGLYIGNQSVLSLYSIGKVSGIVLYSGDGVTHADPIFEGYSIPNAIHRNDMAGRDITNHLVRLLSDKGTILKNSAEREIVRELKEKLCFVSLNYQEDMKNNEAKISEKYQLPDDNFINLDKERFIAPEILFSPELSGYEFLSVDEMVYKSVLKCDIDYRKFMLENIVLSGGNTLFHGFSERLALEMNKKTGIVNNDNVNVKIKANAERKFSPWIGASILTGFSSFQQMWVTKAEYEDNGPSIVHRKCVS